MRGCLAGRGRGRGRGRGQGGTSTVSTASAGRFGLRSGGRGRGNVVASADPLVVRATQLAISKQAEVAARIVGSGQGGQGLGRGIAGGRSFRREAICEGQSVDTINNDPPSPWQFSRAKAHLKACLEDPKDLLYQLQWTPEEVYRSNSLYWPYEKNKFKTNYRSLRRKIESNRRAIEFDEMAVKKEMEEFKRPPVTDRGCPFWDTSEAKKLLKEELASNPDIKSMKASDVQLRHVEYQKFPKAVFANNLQHMKSSLNQSVFWQVKRNRKGRTNHETALTNEETH